MADVLITVTGARGPRGLSGPSLADLAANGGAALIGTASGDTVQEEIDALGAGLFGDTTTRVIDTDLNGSLIGADLGQIFIGNNVVSADAINIDSSGAWPAGISFRRFLGTPGAPTIVTGGTQLGYLDFRGYSGGVFHNAASFDATVDSASGWDPGDVPSTQFRWAVSESDQTYIAMQLRATGMLEIGTLYPVEQHYVAPWSVNHKLLVHSRLNDWTASIVGNPAAGAGFGLRLHTVGETSSDLPLFISSGAGAGTGKVAVTGAGRVGIGTSSPACALEVAGPVKVGNYTVGTVPSAAAGAGQTIYVSNEVGGATLAFSDGAAWRRVADRTVIA